MRKVEIGDGKWFNSDSAVNIYGPIVLVGFVCHVWFSFWVAVRLDPVCFSAC